VTQFCIYKNIKYFTPLKNTTYETLDKCFPTFRQANQYCSKMNEHFAYMRTETVEDETVHIHTFYTIKEEIFDQT